jgi:hypothetical protein
MKKLILFLILGIGIIFMASSAYAMGSPQDTNPNAPNYYKPPAQTSGNSSSSSSSSSSPATTTTTTQTTTSSPTTTCTNHHNGCVPGTTATTATRMPAAGTNFSLIYRKVYFYGRAIDKAGPQIAGRLTDASGQLFFYLAVISLILWVIQNLLFGDKGAKEFFLYFLFLMVVRGLLAGYNFFFVGGVAVFFKDLGQMAAGTSLSPISYYSEMVLNIYRFIIEASLNSGSMVTGLLLAVTGVGEIATVIVFFFLSVILLILGLVIIGTIILIHIYVAIALISGYIIIPFMIFKPLEFLWNGWLKFLITSCLSYFLVYVVMALEEGSLNAVASSSVLNANPETLGSVLAILFLVAIFAYLILKIPSIAGEIVSGMPNMSFSGVTSVVIGAASVMLAGGRIAGIAAKTGAQVMNKAKGDKKE